MTISQAYAQALFHLVQNESEETYDVLIQKLVGVLKRRGHTSLYPRIIRELTKKMEQEGKTDTTIVVAKDSDFAKFDDSIQAILNTLPNTVLSIQKRIDPTLIGGFIVETRTRQYDASYKRRLISLYQNLTT